MPPTFFKEGGFFLSLPFDIEIVFRHPERFLLLFILPAILILVWYQAKKRKNAQKDPWIQLHLSDAKLPGRFKRIFWRSVASLVLVVIIAALTNPERKITEWEKVFSGMRIAILLDSSWSMKGGEDIKPNRMTASKEVSKDFIDLLWKDPDLKGRYTLALIPFAGAAQPFLTGFTTSREEFLFNLSQVNENTITKKGTSLWSAFKAYDTLLLWYPPYDKDTIDLAIIISDGGKEEKRPRERQAIPGLIRELRDSYRAQRIIMGRRFIIRSEEKQRTVIINTVGVGLTEPVPLIVRDRAGNFVDYYRAKENDPKSPILKSQLDEEILKDIAEKYGGGKYINFSERAQLLQEFKNLVLEHRKETGKIPHVRYESVRNWFLAPAFVILYFLFGYGGWLKRLIFFRRNSRSGLD